MRTMHQVIEVLRGKRFPLEDEKNTQAAIDGVLREKFADVQREVPVTGGIIDFMIDHVIGIEIKLKGQRAAIQRQVRRYAADKRIRGIIIVTAKPVSMETQIAGVPIMEISLGSAWL